MKRMIRYKVKADRAEENAELVRAVYAELASVRPEGLRYATYRLPDGVSFVHFAAVSTADGRNPLMEVAAFAKFQEGIGERCEEAPVTVELEEVGSYGM